ncbi:hypothetical protein [Candidatus Walczuchella endosymbiont of Icerya purchasi]
MHLNPWQIIIAFLFGIIYIGTRSIFLHLKCLIYFSNQIVMEI